MKKTGFTLSEVLIALTVIGVIAALTVPALMQNTQKQEYVSALKKTYSTLSQATNMIIAENGSPKCKDEEGNVTGWACSANDVYNMYKKYLNNAKDCQRERCIPYNKYKYLGGGTNMRLWDGGIASDYNFILADGAVLSVNSVIHSDCISGAGSWGSGSINFCAALLIDVNGEKGPNIFGRDAFQFVIKEKGLYPAGCDDARFCSTVSGAWGAGCACKVLREGAMNY